VEGRREQSEGFRLGSALFRNPVFIASGICGYGEEIAQVLDLTRIGGIVTKTVTLHPRPGNPPPRIKELSTGLLNSIGLENVGIDAFLSEKLPPLRGSGVGVVVSIAGDRREEFEALVEKLAGADGYDAVELNLSCPNVEKGMLDHGSDPSFVEEVTSLVKARTRRPVLVKITPNVTSVAEVALAAEAGGADGITAINTLLGADFDPSTGRPFFARVRAGYSGPGILPIALAKVWEVAGAVKVPVVGVGGISSVEDARKFFLAGASAVQVGTAVFSDPLLPERIAEAWEKERWQPKR